MQKKRVVVGLSGGVDSSVAAYVLKEQGYEVVGLFMKNWHDTTGVLKSDCPWLDDKFDAQAVAQKLDIPFHVVDLSDQYRKRVVDYMFSEYEKGRTPNPDVLCNREIKFDVFMDKALELGADFVATGHYCRKETIMKDGKPVYRLLAGSDKKVAGTLKLITAHKKDSQGICFVGKVDLPVFLQQQLEPKKGKVFLIPDDSDIFDRDWDKVKTENPSDEDLEELAKPYPFHPKYGKKIGEHNGAHFYTIGQRKGLNIGGFPEPLFVTGINVDYNQVYVGMGKKHKGLFRDVLFINKDEVHWVRPDLELKEGKSRKYQVRIRYRQPLQEATLHFRDSGQFAAWYDREELVGSGVIS